MPITAKSIRALDKRIAAKVNAVEKEGVKAAVAILDKIAAMPVNTIAQIDRREELVAHFYDTGLDLEGVTVKRKIRAIFGANHKAEQKLLLKDGVGML